MLLRRRYGFMLVARALIIRRRCSGLVFFCSVSLLNFSRIECGRFVVVRKLMLVLTFGSLEWFFGIGSVNMAGNFWHIIADSFSLVGFFFDGKCFALINF